MKRKLSWEGVGQLEIYIHLLIESEGTTGREGAVHVTFKIPLRIWKSERASGIYFKTNLTLR